MAQCVRAKIVNVTHVNARVYVCSWVFFDVAQRWVSWAHATQNQICMALLVQGHNRFSSGEQQYMTLVHAHYQ